MEVESKCVVTDRGIADLYMGKLQSSLSLYTVLHGAGDEDLKRGHAQGHMASWCRQVKMQVSGSSCADLVS